MINKNVTEENLFSVVEAFAAGWHSIKLYFMIGLPTETFADLDGIVDLPMPCCGLADKIGKRPRCQK